MNYLDPICINVDGYLGLNKYAVGETDAHITLTDDPDPAEFGKLDPGLACSGEWSMVSLQRLGGPRRARTAGARASGIRC